MERPHLHIIIEKEIDQNRKLAILDLWNSEYIDLIRLPSIKELEEYFAGLLPLRHLFLVNEQQEVKGWLFLFERAGETWFAMILGREVQGRGYGSALLAEATRLSPVLNGWAIERADYLKADGSVYPSPLGFYVKNGFTVLDDKLTEPFAAVKIRKEAAS